tara:strand:- start:217 stop:1716 length:1500 start_codon:yes stop_codon:yes gene_type:complete
MEPEQFIEDPWKQAHTHKGYGESFLHMRPAPEYASGEVLLASLYRNVGLNVSEGSVPKNGRKLKNLLNSKSPKHSQNFPPEKFDEIISQSLSSPKVPNQSGKRFLQICPLVPDAAIYSLSARLSSNSWNPGNLIASMLCYGLGDEEQILSVWQKIFSSLSITTDDDPWAQTLQREFESIRTPELQEAWSKPTALPNLNEKSCLADVVSATPALQFAKDLISALEIKQLVTRRQWISIIETILRLGSAAHILWLCKANSICYDLIYQSLETGQTIEINEFNLKLADELKIWRQNQPVNNSIKQLAQDYLEARAGICLLLHTYECKFAVTPISMRSPKEIINLTKELAKIRNEFPLDEFKNNMEKLQDQQSNAFACKNGASKNILEFISHILRRRETGERGMESYDQGYFLKRKSGPRSPWVVGFGPVAILTMVHCCSSGKNGARNIGDLCKHLSKYGFSIDPQEIADSDMGRILRNLGLVLDSPDAEGGMILSPPFKFSD